MTARPPSPTAEPVLRQGMTDEQRLRVLATSGVMDSEDDEAALLAGADALAALPVPAPDYRAALRVAHALIQDFHAVTDPELQPELCERANAILLPCDEADECPAVAASSPSLASAPTDGTAWQSIDSAPKERNVLVWDGHVCCEAEKRPGLRGRGDEWVCYTPDGCTSAMDEPTHWMPLPAAPPAPGTSPAPTPR